MAIRAGEHDRFITIERPAKTQNSRGEVILSWPGPIVASAWAKKVPLGAGEANAAEQQFATARYRFELRHYLAGITTEMRLNERGTVFDIEDVQEVGRREALHLSVLQRAV